MNPLVSAAPVVVAAPMPVRSRSVVVQLAATEARRLVTHPAVLVGLVLSVLWLRQSIGTRVPVLQRDDMATGMALLPLAAMTLVAIHLAAGRAVRHGTDELYDSVPLPAGARTAAHLASIAAPFGLAAGLVAAWVVYLYRLNGMGSPSMLELATGPFLVATGGALGVLLARFSTSPALAPLVVVSAAAAEITLMSRGAPGDPVRWLAPWVPPAGETFPWLNGDLPRELMVRRPGWHLGYLAAIGVLAGVVALARHGRSRRLFAAGVGGLALLAGSTWGQTRPATSSVVAAMVRFVERPQDVQVCEERAGVRYCAYPGYEALVDRWAPVVESVLGLVPEEVRGRRLELRQRVPLRYLDATPRAVRQELSVPIFDAGRGPRSWEDDGALHPELRWGRGDDAALGEFALAAQTAAWALNVPTESGAFFCARAGQARTALVLWMAGQTTARASSALALAYEEPAPSGGLPGAGPENFPVVLHGPLWTLGIVDELPMWPRAEVAAALELLDRPVEEVAARVRASWDRLSDPATTTSELAELFGMTIPTPVRSAGPCP